MQSTLSSLTNPRWANAEHTEIDCEITTSQFGDEVLPFTAHGNDPEAHGREIFAAIVAGDYGPIAEYVAPVIDPAVVLAGVRAEAKSRLEATDWSQVADVAAILANKADFDAYRAAVRAVYLDPVADPVWPERPVAVWSS
jgi:hypothetical protein